MVIRYDENGVPFDDGQYDYEADNNNAPLHQNDPVTVIVNNDAAQDDSGVVFSDNAIHDDRPNNPIVDDLAGINSLLPDYDSVEQAVPIDTTDYYANEPVNLEGYDYGISKDYSAEPVIPSSGDTTISTSEFENARRTPFRGGQDGSVRTPMRDFLFGRKGRYVNQSPVYAEPTETIDATQQASPISVDRANALAAQDLGGYDYVSGLQEPSKELATYNFSPAAQEIPSALGEYNYTSGLQQPVAAAISVDNEPSIAPLLTASAPVQATLFAGSSKSKSFAPEDLDKKIIPTAKVGYDYSSPIMDRPISAEAVSVEPSVVPAIANPEPKQTIVASASPVSAEINPLAPTESIEQRVRREMTDKFAEDERLKDALDLINQSKVAVPLGQKGLSADKIAEANKIADEIYSKRELKSKEQDKVGRMNDLESRIQAEIAKQQSGNAGNSDTQNVDQLVQSIKNLNPSSPTYNQIQDKILDSLVEPLTPSQIERLRNGGNVERKINFLPIKGDRIAPGATNEAISPYNTEINKHAVAALSRRQGGKFMTTPADAGLEVNNRPFADAGSESIKVDNNGMYVIPLKGPDGLQIHKVNLPSGIKTYGEANTAVRLITSKMNEEIGRIKAPDFSGYMAALGEREDALNSGKLDQLKDTIENYNNTLRRESSSSNTSGKSTTNSSDKSLSSEKSSTSSNSFSQGVQQGSNFRSGNDSSSGDKGFRSGSSSDQSSSSGFNKNIAGSNSTASSNGSRSSAGQSSTGNNSQTQGSSESDTRSKGGSTDLKDNRMAVLNALGMQGNMKLEAEMKEYETKVKGVVGKYDAMLKPYIAVQENLSKNMGQQIKNEELLSNITGNPYLPRNAVRAANPTINSQIASYVNHVETTQPAIQNAWKVSASNLFKSVDGNGNPANDATPLSSIRFDTVANILSGKNDRNISGGTHGTDAAKLMDKLESFSAIEDLAYAPIKADGQEEAIKQMAANRNGHQSAAVRQYNAAKVLSGADIVYNLMTSQKSLIADSKTGESQYVKGEVSPDQFVDNMISYIKSNPNNKYLGPIAWELMKNNMKYGKYIDDLSKNRGMGALWKDSQKTKQYNYLKALSDPANMQYWIDQGDRYK